MADTWINNYHIVNKRNTECARPCICIETWTIIASSMQLLSLILQCNGNVFAILISAILNSCIQNLGCRQLLLLYYLWLNVVTTSTFENVTGCRDTRTAKSKETRQPGWLHKTVKYTTPLQRSFSIYMYNEKRYVGGLYTSLFCAIIPTLFPYFLPFWYPYILLHFQMFFITCLCHFF